MPRTSEVSAPRRAYALMSIIVMTTLIVVGAGILLVIGREADLTGIKETRSTESYGVATAGLQWMLANMSSNAGRDAAVLAATGTSNVINPGSVTLHPFNATDEWAGVGVAPPAVGTSNTDWIAFGRGHYGLLAAIDPLDRTRSVLIRSIGIVGDTQVVLETNLSLNITQTVPSGFTGCFDAAFQITYYDQEGPYDYTGNFRIDGIKGVPMAISADHNRINGLARDDPGPGVTPAFDVTYVRGRQWRGTQTLRGGPLASGVANGFGGTQAANLLDTGSAPMAGWDNNPYIANDPRIVDSFNTGAGPKGLGLGANGAVYASTGTPDVSAAATQPRGTPIIAFIGAPSAAQTATANGGLLAQTNWGGEKDDKARKGFYACDNHGGANGTINLATEVCVKGSAGAGAADWGNNAVNHSGRGYGFIQSIQRQCTGSGNSINTETGSPFYDALNNTNGIRCARGFEWLENAAACLILPATVSAQNGSNALRPAEDAGGAANNFRGCHPGCLIATDIDNDGDLDAQDRPFRSVCVNLDASVASTYGPGALPGKAGGAYAGATDPYDPDGAGALGSSWAAFQTNAAVLTGPTLTAIDAGTPGTDASFVFADLTTVRLAGAVTERGNGAFITRLDMSDRGPLGTCEQNCLAYGWGRDFTYGAHRTDLYGSPGAAGSAGDTNCVALVPDHAAAGETLEVCNFDYDYDGFVDRKSYALSSSYREECTDAHDGVAYAPAFNISSSNPNLGGTGCSNAMPNMAAGVTAQRIVPFCEGNDQEIREAIAELASQATVITSANLNNSGADLADGDGWFGGARCHMGDAQTFGGAALTHPHGGNLTGLDGDDVDRLGHPDYWIEDTCPDPVVLRIDTSANINVGKVCGCGIIIFTDNALMFSGPATFLWRGLVIWDLKTAGKELRIDNSGAGTFVVEGAVLLTGVHEMEFKITKNVAGGATVSNPADQRTVKQLYRLNEQAITDAFSAIRAPVRSVRRLR